MSWDENSKIKAFGIAECKTESFLLTCPIEIPQNLISQLKAIFQSYKDIRVLEGNDHGKVSCKEGFVFFFSYPSRLFYTVLVETSDNSSALDNQIRNMCDRINLELTQNTYLESNANGKYSLSKAGQEIVFKIFELYKIINKEGNLILDETDLNSIDVSHYFPSSTPTITKPTTTESEVKIINSSFTSLKEEDNGIEIFPDEEGKDQLKLFRKDMNELKKVEWWRRMKLFFIIICFIFAIVLYTIVPILLRAMNPAHHHGITNLTNNTNTTTNSNNSIIK